MDSRRLNLRTTLNPGALIALLLLPACTPKNPEPELQKAYDRGVNVENVETLRITKNYPGESAWSVQLKRTGPGLPGNWRIESAPVTVIDAFADAPFIHHFLDTIKTLRPALEAPEGPKSSQGFEPARAVLEWTETVNAKKVERKLVLGDAYGLNGRFAIFAPGTRAVIAGGALLEMLEHAVDWQTLRMKRLVTWEIDDIDLVRVGTATYERVGTRWEKSKKDVTPRFLPALENLMHQRILRFVDEKAEADSIELKTADRGPLLQIEFEDRKQKTQRISFYKWDSKIYAKNTTRSGWFELYPEVLLSWSDLIQSDVTPVKSGMKK